MKTIRVRCPLSQQTFCAFCARLRLNSEEALDGGEDAGGGVSVGGGVVGLGGEALAAFDHNETEGFAQVRIRNEPPFHGGVADFEDFSLFQREHIRGSRLASE